MICEETYHQQPQGQIKEHMMTMMMMDPHQSRKSPLSSPSSPSSSPRSSSPRSPSFNNINNEEERLEVVNMSGMALESLPNPSINLAQICKLDLSNNYLQVRIWLYTFILSCMIQCISISMYNFISLGWIMQIISTFAIFLFYFSSLILILF